MDIITFPLHEWPEIQSRLRSGGTVKSIRCSAEYGRYQTGNICETEWGELLRIQSVRAIKKIEDYEHFECLTPPMLKELRQYDRFEILTIVSHLR